MKNDNASYLRDLAERLMHVPVMYGTDGGDVDRLARIAAEMKAKEPKTDITITLKDLLSDTMMKAMRVAEYRLRHNALYVRWDDTRRTRYMLERGFRAVVAARV